jgi:hypothetical protein
MKKNKHNNKTKTKTKDREYPDHQRRAWVWPARGRNFGREILGAALERVKCEKIIIIIPP